jgi:hypothetical protein
MDEELLKQFARQLDSDADAVLDRWHGRPDLIIDDIFQVRDLDTGEVRDLELFDVQRKLVHAYFYSDAGTLNAYKGRRIGYSFAVVASFLLEGMFYGDSFYPLVSRSLSQAKDRIKDIEHLIDNAKVDIPTQKTNTDEIQLWNDTTFMAFSADSDTSRGADSARAVLMDEMAFMEDEERAHRAFGAFLALGQNRKMVQVSTPNTRNDLFMKEHRRGSPTSENGVLAIKQPTFDNADDIDINTPLYEQETVPVRPEINIDQLETQRMSDPEGFGQEYLCRPVVDEYRFFDEDAIVDAMERAENDVAYQYGIGVDKPHGAHRVAGVDIGINRDDTVISVTDHINGRREQKALIVADDEILRRAGVQNPDRANANHIAQLLNYIDRTMAVDIFIMDKGGPGETFQRIVEKQLGRKVIPFDFSAKDDVNDMMGDMNVALREGDVRLVPDDRLRDELAAIVKEKRDHYARPKYSGKEHSQSGKDDAAIATVLSAFPPNFNADTVTSPRSRSTEEPTPERGAMAQDGDGSHELNRVTNASHGRRQIRNKRRSRRHRYQGRQQRTR